jgi:type I site-specific restriction endonuclease
MIAAIIANRAFKWVISGMALSLLTWSLINAYQLRQCRETVSVQAEDLKSYANAQKANLGTIKVLEEALADWQQSAQKQQEKQSFATLMLSQQLKEQREKAAGAHEQLEALRLEHKSVCTAVPVPSDAWRVLKQASHH